MNTDLADLHGFIKNIDRFNPDVLEIISANQGLISPLISTPEVMLRNLPADWNNFFKAKNHSYFENLI